MDRPLGVHDDFFELGGHSLLAARAVVRLRTMLNADVPMRLIFECPTIALLVPHLPVAESAPAPVIPRQPRKLGVHP